MEFGATHSINSGKVNAVEEIQKLTGGGIEYTLECTGIPKVLRQAVDCLMLGGHLRTDRRGSCRRGSPAWICRLFWMPARYGRDRG